MTHRQQSIVIQHKHNRPWNRFLKYKKDQVSVADCLAIKNGLKNRKLYEQFMLTNSKDQKISFLAITEFRNLLSTYDPCYDHSPKEIDNITSQINLQLKNLAMDLENILNSFSLINDKSHLEHKEGIITTRETDTNWLKRQDNKLLISKKNQQVFASTPIKHYPDNQFNDSPIGKIIGLKHEYIEGSSIKCKKCQQTQFDMAHLQQQKKSLLDKIQLTQEKLKDITKEKRYCLEILNKNSHKESDISIENKVLRNQNIKLNRQIKQLQKEVRGLARSNEQQTLLIKDIQKFFSKEEGAKARKSHYNSTRKPVQCKMDNLQILSYQNEIYNLKTQLSSAALQNKELLAKEIQLTSIINSLQKTNEVLKFKNQQLVNLQESKKLNLIVHRQNKHLLQVNYELGNKLYNHEKQIGRLMGKIVKLEGQDQQQFFKSTKSKNQEEFAFSTTPSITRRICLSDRTQPQLIKAKSVTDFQYSSSQNVIFKLNQKLKEQNSINFALKNKIQQLQNRLCTYKKQYKDKHKLAHSENVVLNSFSDITQKASTELTKLNSCKSANDRQSMNQLQLNDKRIYTLEQFVENFQLSSMQILFIMLRITQIAVVMFEQSCIKTMTPPQILLEFDQEDKPQNIIVQLKNESNLPVSKLFQCSQQLTQQFEDSIVWNIGMVFYYILYKKTYIRKDNLSELMVENEQQKHQLTRILQAALQENPYDRISLNGLLENISKEINKILCQYD